MSGRIRSIKPEWLDDERLAECSSDARVLSIALLLEADDHGNGRAWVTGLAGRVFPGKPRETLAKALEELRAIRYVLLYEVDGQHYFSIRNWLKHQKVDHPGKPKVPPPNTGNTQEVPHLARIRETLVLVPDTLAPDQEGKGTDRKGEEVEREGKRKSPAPTRPVDPPKPMSPDWKVPLDQAAALAAQYETTPDRIQAQAAEFVRYWSVERAETRRNAAGWRKSFARRVKDMAESGVLYLGAPRGFSLSSPPADDARKAKLAEDTKRAIEAEIARSRGAHR